MGLTGRLAAPVIQRVSDLRVPRLELRHLYFVALWLVTSVLFWPPLKILALLVIQDERYSHIAVVPLISAALLWLKRHTLMTEKHYCPTTGAPLIALGLLVNLAARARLPISDSLSLSVFALLLTWTGVFICCFGLGSLTAASFPFAFLLWMVPLPGKVLEGMVTILQAGSASASYFLMRLAGVPVLRNGLILGLPNVDIEVARQCSGVRSAISLFMTGTFIAQLLLRSTWKKLVLITCIVPVLILKNAMRIVCISILGVYVNRGFLFGNLHRYGGLPFSLVGLAMLLPLLWMLWRSEQGGMDKSSRRLPRTEHGSYSPESGASILRS